MLEYLSCHAETVALVCCLPALAYFVCKWLFEKDTALEDRRRGAGLLASKLTALGLKRLPALLTDYSVGDYASLISHFEDAINIMLDSDGDDAVLKEFSGTFANVLTAELGTPDGLALVKSKLASLAPAAPAIAA